MTTELVIIGCGGHGRELFAIANAMNDAESAAPRWNVRGFVDDHPSDLSLKRVQQLDAAFLGRVGSLPDLPANTHVIVGIGDPRARRRVGDRLDELGLAVASLIHPDATIGPDTVAGEGLVAFAGARVTTNVTLGRHVHLNQNVTVGHDSTVGDYVSVNPLAAVSGECRLDNGVLIGTTAAVLQGLRIGIDATVGAGACVVHDVPPGVVVKGVPAK